MVRRNRALLKQTVRLSSCLDSFYLVIATEAQKTCYHFYKLRLYKCTENCAWIMKENIVKTSQNSANSPEY